MPKAIPLRPLTASEYQELIDGETAKAGKVRSVTKADEHSWNTPRWNDEKMLKSVNVHTSPTGTAVNHPSHYNQGKIECIDALRETMTKAEFSGFCRGNAFKYLWRHRDKNEVEDLKKARVYLNWLIENESSRS